MKPLQGGEDLASLGDNLIATRDAASSEEVADVGTLQAETGDASDQIFAAAAGTIVHARTVSVARKTCRFMTSSTIPRFNSYCEILPQLPGFQFPLWMSIISPRSLELQQDDTKPSPAGQSERTRRVNVLPIISFLAHTLGASVETFQLPLALHVPVGVGGVLGG